MPSRARAAAAFCARATCGQVASTIGSPRRSTARFTSGVTPWLRMTTVSSSRASSKDDTARTPWRSNRATTRGLWMSGPSVHARPPSSTAAIARSSARFTP